MSDQSLTLMRDDWVARAKADEFFIDIPVFSERNADITNDAANALAIITEKNSKIGAALVVQSPIASDNLPEVTFGPLDVIASFLVLTDPLYNDGANGTQKDALTIARRIYKIFKHTSAQGIYSAMIPEERPFEPVPSPLAPVAYEIRFRTREIDPTIDTKVAMPTITPAGGTAPQTVTLATVTAGASIYYTLDGSHPWSGNEAATLYAAPFDVEAAATLRAGAFKSGSIASNINQGIYT